MTLVDTTVPLCPVRKDRPHGAVHALLANRTGLFPRPLTLEEATGVVELWLNRPAAVVVHPSGRHLSLLRGLLGAVGTAANLVNDAHLAALALEHGAEIVSFDRDFARFEGVRLQIPA